MKRAIIMVIDSMGIGAMPDCEEFGDIKECNTLRNVCAFNKGLDVPSLELLGLGNIQDFEGINKTATPIGQYGTLREKSKGKDTTTGHWEMDLFQKNHLRPSHKVSQKNLLTNSLKKLTAKEFWQIFQQAVPQLSNNLMKSITKQVSQLFTPLLIVFSKLRLIQI